MKYIAIIFIAWLCHIINITIPEKQLCNQAEIANIAQSYENNHWYISSYLNKHEISSIQRQMHSLHCNPGIQMKKINEISPNIFQIYISGIYQ